MSARKNEEKEVTTGQNTEKRVTPGNNMEKEVSTGNNVGKEIAASKNAEKDVLKNLENVMPIEVCMESGKSGKESVAAMNLTTNADMPKKNQHPINVMACMGEITTRKDLTKESCSTRCQFYKTFFLHSDSRLK
jgi:hypothetical protein